VQAYLGELGGRIEAQGKLVATLAGSTAPPLKRLSYLVKLASGETAPLGPAADRARAETMRLMRDTTLRAELASDPAQMSAVRELVQGAGLAA
jgi:hypothetical protein